MTEAAIVEFQLVEVVTACGVVLTLTCLFVGAVLIARSYFESR